jgi:DNA-binding NarL/FixJ family response regulator
MTTPAALLPLQDSVQARSALLSEPMDAFPDANRPHTTVVIVEDSPIVRARLANLITESGFAVITGEAADGFKAQALVRQSQPNVVVLDIQVPGVNGLELLAQFRKEIPGCLLIVLTTYAFEEFRQRCLALGADYFFDKSTEFDRVTEVLASFQPRAQRN